MTDKMLKFVKLNRQTPEKRKFEKMKKIALKKAEKERQIKELMISMKFTSSILTKKQKNNQADALNVESHFAKFIVHYITIFRIGLN